METTAQQRAHFHVDQFEHVINQLIRATADKPRHAEYLISLLAASPDAVEDIPVPPRVTPYIAQALRADVASALQYPPRLGTQYISLRVSALEGAPTQAEYLTSIGWSTAGIPG